MGKFRDLIADLGFLGEDQKTDIEAEINAKLDKSEKMDEIDSVTFGLETDDGKIVKVYVKADEANDFEKELSKLLGEVDDIEEALGELSKKFEIVDVEWPEDDKTDDDDAETGSDILDKKVYDNENDKKAQDHQPMEGVTPSFGEAAAIKFLGEEGADLANRFTTAAQSMVYHAILELGVPEKALVHSAYRGDIIKGIKEKADDVANQASMKQALKSFINASINYERGAYKAELDDKKDEKDDAQGKKKVDEAVLVESPSSDYWGGMIKLIKYLGNDDTATALLNSAPLKTLIQSSSANLTDTVSTEVIEKMAAMSADIDAAQDQAADSAEGINESASADEVTLLMQTLLTKVDSSSGKSDSAAVLKSSEYAEWLLQAKENASSSFNGDLRTDLDAVQTALKDGNDDAPASTAKTDTTAPAPAPATESVVAEASDIEPATWSFDKDADEYVISYGGVSFNLDGENVEAIVSGIGSRETTTVETEDGKKVIFSPRGTKVLVKVMGTTSPMMMDSDEVDSFLTFIQHH